MLLRNQALAPLETIYEESGSFIASNVDLEHQLNNHGYKNETISGLISSRSVPPVDIQRQHANENQKKPPIEVRFRDGSKRFIHPSAIPPAMIINRRKFVDSSHENLSSNTIISNSNYRQTYNMNYPKKSFRSKAPLVITIITADDLYEAGITPTISSSSDDSETASLVHSPSKSSIDSLKRSQNSLSYASTQLPIQRIPSASMLSRPSPVNHSQQQQQQNTTNQRRHSISSQASVSSTNESLNTPIQYSQTLATSSKVAMNNDENKRNANHSDMISCSPSPSRKQLSNKTVTSVNQSDPKLLPGGGSRSAFRPFNRSLRFNDQSHSTTLQPTPNINRRFDSSLQQQQQALSNIQNSQEKQSSISSLKLTKVSLLPPAPKLNSLVAKRSYDSMLLKQKVSDITAKMNSINSTINPKQSYPLPTTTKNITDNSLNLPRLLNMADKFTQNISSKVNSNLKWFNINSNSINDIPRLSSRYSRIPLHINLPATTPTHNQKYIIKHDVALENRLLNAGLSPETVALYERILNIAENPQMSKLASPLIIDPYTNKNFI